MNNVVIIKKTENRGVGLFANRNFKKGELIVHGRALYKVKQITAHSFQINENTHMQLDRLSRSINHSCDPNTGVRNNDCRAYDFIALKDIKAGEEITWNYETAEYIVIWLKKCLCRAKHCKGEIRGFKFLDKKTRNKYGEYIADYLKLTS